MELTPAQISALQSLTVKSTGPRGESLTVGQKLEATVIASTPTKNEITLQIAKEIFNARTNLALAVGQQLELLVKQAGKQLVLQIEEANLQQLLTQQTLRDALPKQKPLSETLNQLQNFVTQTKQLGIKSSITNSIEKFISQLPTPQQLSQAQSLKQIIQQSGLFFENKLLNTLSNKTSNLFNTDLKGFLINLKNKFSRESQSITTKNSEAETNIKNSLSPTTPPMVLTKKIQESLALSKQMLENEKIKHTKDILANPDNVKKQIEGQQNQGLINKISQQQLKLSSGLKNIIGLHSQNLLSQKPVTQAQNTLNPTTKQDAVYKNTADLNRNIINAELTKTQNKTDGAMNKIGNFIDLIDNLSKQIESAISRTQVQQLTTLQDQDNGKLSWSMEIPYQDDDNLHMIQLELQKENQNNSENDPILTVNLALDLDQLGPIHARITLINKSVGVVFWAEKFETVTLTQNHEEELNQGFVQSGLTPENISFHHGKPPEKIDNDNNSHQNLLDVKV